ncbi:hypothetical protein JCM8097_006733 [Rhodosporidiobolus ruineniae]
MRFSLAVSALLALASASGVLAGHKKKVQAPRTLCPNDEVACPILSSTTYDEAVKHHFATKGEVTGVMAGKGGYECINVQEALDSCGGCASTGEGVNCSAIRGSAGVGCHLGKCVVFSCQPGWKPSLKGDKCVRARSGVHSSAKNDTRNAARMHLEGKRMAPHVAPLSS